jgi:hypothetical protein
LISKFSIFLKLFFAKKLMALELALIKWMGKKCWAMECLCLQISNIMQTLLQQAIAP